MKQIVFLLALLLVISCGEKKSEPAAAQTSDPDACTCAREIFAKGRSAEIYDRCSVLRNDSTFAAHYAICSAAAQMNRADTVGLRIGKPTEELQIHITDGTYQVVLGQEKIKWTGTKPSGKKHIGFINAKSAKFTVKDHILSGGEIVLDMKSITNEDLKNEPESKARLEKHLHSPDFFDTAKFPEARFVITSVRAEEGGDYVAVGQLTIKGITRQSNADVRIKDAGEGSALCTGVLKFDRSEFDVRYGSGTFFDNLGDDLISNEIQIQFTFVAKR